MSLDKKEIDNIIDHVIVKILIKTIVFIESEIITYHVRLHF